MIIEYIRYEAPGNRGDELLAAYRSAVTQLAASENCLRFEISRGIEQPEHITVRIEWDSVEGHEQSFRHSALFAPFLTTVGPFMDLIQEMKHYRTVAHGEGSGFK